MGDVDGSARQGAQGEYERLLQELRDALTGSEQRLAVTLDALAEAVTIRGDDDRLIYANRAALERMGVESVAALRESDPRALLEPYLITSEDGREIHVEDLPSARLLRGEDPEPLLLRTVHRASGEEHWTLLKATPVHDPGGRVESAVTIIEDVTAEHRAAVRMQFLARAGQVLASSLDYEQTLHNVAGLAVPRIADWCAVDLFDDRGLCEPVAVAHSDPSRIPLAERLRAFEAEELDTSRGLGRVRRTGESQLYGYISDETLVRAARSPEHLAMLRAVGMRAVLIVPLRVHARTIGTLTLVQSESSRSFDEHDLAFVEQIAARAALAVEHARLYRERSELAQTLQRSLLPDALPELPGWEVAALYRPAGAHSEVGGDFYDLWEVGEDWLVLIGDVTGKGVGAATLTSLVRHTARAASDFDSRPAEVLARVDAALQRRPSLALCTALCLRLSGEEVTIAAAGHPLPLRLLRGEVTEAGRYGLLLGAKDGVARTEDTIHMRRGESLVAFTDGVTDALGADRERYGGERLVRRLREIREESPSAVLQRIVEGIEDFQVGPQADDTAVLVARYNGANADSTKRAERATALGAAIA
jgi:PAS domain S-box-containing protein